MALAEKLRLTPQASIDRQSSETSASSKVDMDEDSFNLLGSIHRTNNKGTWFGPT